MPSPIAHPAAAIPFTRVGLVLSALVIGSIAPDFGYFMPLPGSFFMYTLPGLFLFDLPVGLILLWGFHTFAKWPLLSLLPSGLQRRLYKPAQGFSFGPSKRFFLILLSLLVGAVSHVVWDSFTHSYGWTVIQFPILETPIRGIPLYALLQDGGSVVGIALILYWLLRWWPSAPQSDRLPPRFPGTVQMIFALLTFVSLLLVEGRIFYLRMLTGSRFIGGPLLLNSVRISAIFIISLFVGIYCVAWMFAFYKQVHPAQAAV